MWQLTIIVGGYKKIFAGGEVWSLIEGSEIFQKKGGLVKILKSCCIWFGEGGYKKNFSWWGYTTIKKTMIVSGNLAATISDHLPQFAINPICLAILQVINLIFMKETGANLIEKILF